MVTNIDKRKLKKISTKKLSEGGFEVEGKQYINKISRKISWNTSKNSMLQACDEVCGKKKNIKKTWRYMVVE